MRVIIPYANAEHIFKVAWAVRPYQPELVPLSGGGDEDYYQLIRSLWDRAETFAIVEQDIVVSRDTLDSLRDCSEDWCGSPYPYMTSLHLGLGCVRFSDILIRQQPDLMEAVGLEEGGPQHPPRHWCYLDQAMGIVLRRRNVHAHAHPQVKHLGSCWPSHGCATPPTPYAQFE